MQIRYIDDDDKTQYMISKYIENKVVRVVLLKVCVPSK